MRILLISDGSHAKAVSAALVDRLKTFELSDHPDIADTFEDAKLYLEQFSYQVVMVRTQADIIPILQHLLLTYPTTARIVYGPTVKPTDANHWLRNYVDDVWVLTHPYNDPSQLREMKARMHAIVRRYLDQPTPLATCGPITLHLPRRELHHADGRKIYLAVRWYLFLECLVMAKGNTCDNDKIMAHVYGGDVDHFSEKSNNVSVLVCRVREILKTNGYPDHTIETVWGRGYRINLELGAPAIPVTEAAE